MLRNLSVILALSVVVTACGGSSSGKKNSSSSLSSSVISSSTASEAPASSSVSSASSDSSSSSSECPLPENISLDITRFEPNYQHEVTVTPSNDGTQINFAKTQQSAIIKLSGTKINRATLEISVVIDETFIASGGSLQAFVQSTDDYSKYDFKGPDASELKADELIVIRNELDDIAAFDTDSLQVGLQATGTDPVSGIVDVKSFVIIPAVVECGGEDEELPPTSSSSAPSDTSLYTANFASGITGWNATNGSTDSTEIAITHDSAAGALVVTPKNWSAANYLYSVRHSFSPALTTAAGKTIEAVISVPQSYITENLQIQLFAISSLAEQYGADYSNALSLTDGVDGKYTLSYTIGETVGGKLDGIGIQPYAVNSNASNLDPIKIHSVTIK